MRLTIIGCGDAFGSGGRFNTCFMIEAGGQTMLLDCGASSLVALEGAEHRPRTRSTALFSSHLHGDHFGALPFLLLDCAIPQRRERPLTIAGPPGTRERLDAACEVFFPRSSTQSPGDFRSRSSRSRPACRTKCLGFAIRTAEVVHQSGAPSTAVRLIRRTARLLSYSGDTEWTDALIPHRRRRRSVHSSNATITIARSARPHEFFRPAAEARRASRRGGSCSPT